MNANVSGLGETEELKNSSPSAESPEPQDSVEPIEAVTDAASQLESADGATDALTPTATMDQDAEQAQDAEPVVEAEADAPAAPAAEVEAEDTAEPVAQAEAEAEAELVMQAEAEPVAQAEADAEAEAEPIMQAEADADAEIHVDAGEAADAQDAGSWLDDDEAAPGLKPFKRGDLLEGTVTSTSPTAVYVDLGGKGEGLIPGRELERMNRETLEMLKQPGVVVPVYVVNPNDHKGDLILSVNRALEELDWRKAEEHRESQEVYESHVAGYNKGGLIVRFGRLRGFVPQSQLGADRKRVVSGETPEDRWGAMVNESIAVKVMEVDRARNRLILSERAAARESRESRKETLINRLRVGEIRTGKVVSLVDFGAFVDIGGAEGLVHLTEISWIHVTHPRELLRIGQEVRVEVISIDADAKRIGLSMKRQEADPWDTIAINYQVGQLVQGIVTKLTKFGAFTRLVDVPEIEGLVHISELSDQRVNHPREVVKEGETVTLRVVKMDIENRRLGLSLKRVNSAEYLDMDWSAPGEE